MPVTKPLKINLSKHPDLVGVFSEEDPDTIFNDQREIGHGSFGAVYYVSIMQCVCVCVCTCMYACVCVCVMVEVMRKVAFAVMWEDDNYESMHLCPCFLVMGTTCIERTYMYTYTMSIHVSVGLLGHSLTSLKGEHMYCIRTCPVAVHVDIRHL